MTHLQALILGIVEGITEFLPISSTGHLILAGKLLKLPESDFLKSFEIIIQLGAILSVVALYWRRLFMSWESFKRIAVAFIPTAILGLALYKVIKLYLLGNTMIVLWSLLIGGVILIIFEKMMNKRVQSASRHATMNTTEEIEKLPLKKAAYIGLCQAVAFIPGVSRSGATIVGGMLLGVSRAAIVEFSFLLAVPTMAAATGLDLIKNADSFSTNNASLLAIGAATSFAVATFAIKFLIKFVQKHSFVGFGIYRILVAVGLWLYLF